MHNITHNLTATKKKNVLILRISKKNVDVHHKATTQGKITMVYDYISLLLLKILTSRSWMVSSVFMLDKVYNIGNSITKTNFMMMRLPVVMSAMWWSSTNWCWWTSTMPTIKPESNIWPSAIINVHQTPYIFPNKKNLSTVLICYYY